MKNRILNYALCLVALVSTVVALPYLPDSVPMHFDTNGAVDRYGSKYEMLILPAALILINVLAELGFLRGGKKRHSLDSRAVKSADSNAKVTSVSITVLSLVFVILNFGLLYAAHTSVESFGELPFDFAGLSAVAIGISFVVMGNYMPKTKRNSIVGMRIIWSMYNDVTWQKTNRFAAYAMMVSGIVTALCGLILGGMISLFVLLGAMVIALVISSVYSYTVYKKEKWREND